MATHDEIITLLKAEVKRAGNQSRLANEIGVIQQHISLALNEDIIRPALASALGFKVVMTYEKIK